MGFVTQLLKEEELQRLTGVDLTQVLELVEFEHAQNPEVRAAVRRSIEAKVNEILKSRKG